MSSEEVSIRVASLGKCYQIYERPQDRLKQSLVPRLRRMIGQPATDYFREFWALRDVSFEVRKGETVSIIGRNGSGKSTLLQLICGTLTPTLGTVETTGRVAALLELGAGFNPEFTGRENVFLNATLLGLTRVEIDACFAEIAAFADIGNFIEQPVKTYSSGMFVRLAFAVAVAVEPDILIVDEALSVGDLAFQNKCMSRIRRMSESGVTILFVSHDLSTSQVICTRTVWLDRGQIERIGDPVQVCQDYYVASLGAAEKQQPATQVIQQQQTGMARFTEVGVVDASGVRSAAFRVGDRLAILFALDALEPLSPVVFAISVYRSDGDWLIGQTSRETRVVWPGCTKGETLRGEILFKEIILAPGDYNLALAAYSEDFAICFAMTGIVQGFSIRSEFPTWGKLIHPAEWKCLQGV